MRPPWLTQLGLPAVLLGWPMLVACSLAQMGDPSPAADPAALAASRRALMAGAGLGLSLLLLALACACLTMRRAPRRAVLTLLLLLLPPVALAWQLSRG